MKTHTELLQFLLPPSLILSPAAGPLMVQGTCPEPSCFHSIWPGMPSPPVPGAPIGSSKFSLSSSKAKFKPQLLSLMQAVSLPLDGPSASCSPVCQVLRGSMANVHGIEGKLQTCSLSSFLFCDSRGRGVSEVRGHSGTWRWQMSPEPHPPSHGVTSPLQEILQVLPGGRVLLRGFAGW